MLEEGREKVQHITTFPESKMQTRESNENKAEDNQVKYNQALPFSYFITVRSTNSRYISLTS